MKITSRTMQIDADTFQLILVLTVEVPIEAMIDDIAKIGRNEIERQIGKSLLSAYENYTKQDNLNNNA